VATAVALSLRRISPSNTHTNPTPAFGHTHPSTPTEIDGAGPDAGNRSILALSPRDT
jgi:hypothetical protein